MQTKLLPKHNTLKLLCFSLLLILNNCKNREEEPKTPDCGCNSKVIGSIPESANLKGKLFFKNNSSGGNYNNKKYWIVYAGANCGNCIHNMIICNDNILSDINNIPSLNNVNDIIGSMNEITGGIEVKFSGELKKICEPIFSPADYTYENITLTKIQVQ